MAVIVVFVIIGATVMIVGGGTCTACYCFKRRRKRHIEKIYQTVYNPVDTNEDDTEKAINNNHNSVEDEKDVKKGEDEEPEERVEKINIAASLHDILYEETIPLKIEKWTMQ